MGSSRPSPHHSPRPSSMHSPPITPAATRSRDAIDSSAKGGNLQKVEAVNDQAAVTPQISPPGTSPSTTNVDDSRPTSSGQVTGPSSHASNSTAPTKHHGHFSIGPTTHDSVPASREQSPSRAIGPGATYSRPFTPAGDANDPYAAHKRVPQPKGPENIDSRFKFHSLSSKNRVNSGSSMNLPRSSRSAVDVNPSEKRHSNIFGGHKEHLAHEDSSSNLNGSKHGSMSELKRVLKLGGHHKAKRAASPTPSSKSGTKTPPHHKTPQQLPFGDDHGLQSKYGKFGKVLGAGAGGSVRLMQRRSSEQGIRTRRRRSMQRKSLQNSVLDRHCIMAISSKLWILCMRRGDGTKSWNMHLTTCLPLL